MNLLTGTKAYSILKNKCPQCHEGDLFVNRNVFSKEFYKMHETCSVCSLKYERETGFYYGAMYVSYGVSVTYSIAIFLLYLITATNFDLEMYLLINGVSLFALSTVILRLSRAIWINIFVKYQSAESERKTVIN